MSTTPQSENTVVELVQNRQEIVLESNVFVGNYVLTNDPRLTDNRNPLNHNFSHFLNGSDPITPESIGAQPSGNYILANDSRLSDSRIPIVHKSTHSIGGSDILTPEDIGAQPSGNYVNFPVVLNSLSNNTNESINIVKRLAKAWVNFNGTGTLSIRSSFNISSVIDNGVGNYTINFIIPFMNSNYCFVTWTRDYNNDNTLINNGSARLGSVKTNSSINLFYNNLNNGVFYDTPEFNIVFFGE